MWLDFTRHIRKPGHGLNFSIFLKPGFWRAGPASRRFI